MKRCTYCGREHPDEATKCELDQQPLESFVASPVPTESSSPSPNTDWPPQVVIPAVIWLIVNFLLIGLLGISASFFFGLLTATWAAIDCSKLQSKGSRTLGIAFKPLVVFAAVAFFLWGFGFIWYLIMRNRVRTEPESVSAIKENPTPKQTDDWKCHKCGEDNPMTFDSCWNCHTRGKAAQIISADTGTPPSFPRGGNSWE